MSATDQMRAMLDQLMGTARNGESNKYSIKFTDPKVCKSFLLGCCPHDILSSTRMDLGECSKIHDLALRADYENASKSRDFYYDIDAMEQLETFIAECDRRTEVAKQRLLETQEELSAEVAEKAEKVHQLAEQIGKKLARAETLGQDGLVDESLKLMNEIDDLRKEKAEAEEQYRNSMPASSYQQQKLRVCEVCSAYLGIHDNDRRLADHFGGKLHLGFITIREKLADLQKTVEERRRERRAEQKEDIGREDRRRDRRDDHRHRRSHRSREDRDRSRPRSRDDHRSLGGERRRTSARRPSTPPARIRSPPASQRTRSPSIGLGKSSPPGRERSPIIVKSKSPLRKQSPCSVSRTAWSPSSLVSSRVRSPSMGQSSSPRSPPVARWGRMGPPLPPTPDYWGPTVPPMFQLAPTFVYPSSFSSTHMDPYL